MKNLLKLEQFAVFALCVYLNYTAIPYQKWLYWALLLAPDIGMIGYLFGNRVGAVVYNLFHHQGLAIIFYIFGLQLHQPALQLIGLILLGHSALDRTLGYGLKLVKGFKYTHLGNL